MRSGSKQGQSHITVYNLTSQSPTFTFTPARSWPHVLSELWGVTRRSGRGSCLLPHTISTGLHFTALLEGFVKIERPLTFPGQSFPYLLQLADNYFISPSEFRPCATLALLMPKHCIQLDTAILMQHWDSWLWCWRCEKVYILHWNNASSMEQSQISGQYVPCLIPKGGSITV